MGRKSDRLVGLLGREHAPDGAHAPGEPGEICQIDGLGGIAERFFGLWVNLNESAVEPGGGGR